MHIDPSLIIPCSTPTHKRFQRLWGQTFGRLTVLEFVGKHPSNKTYIWKSKCSCGKETYSTGSALLTGTTRSCGCIRFGVAQHKTHGMSHSPEYRSWGRMKKACTDPTHHNYSNYGGRGITFCPRWEKFENFYADMGPRPENHTIDRIDNNGNYEPDNCRWATPRQQLTNKRNNVRITFKDETMTLMEWSERIGCIFNTLELRLKRGWSVEDALTRPIAKNGPRTGKGMSKYATDLPNPRPSVPIPDP